MKELQEIIKKYKNHVGQDLCLATVVRTRGSSYRRAGARMLIANHQQTAGSISGGCLEADVIAHAKMVWAQGASQLLIYDTTTDEDILMGTGLGCNGVMEILVESLRYGSSGLKLLRFVEKVFRNRSCGVAATVIRSDVSNCRLGARLMLDKTGYLQDDLSNGSDEMLKEMIVTEMVRVLDERKSVTHTFNTTNGSVDVFLEMISAPTQLFIFGAGHDATPIVNMAREIGFAVTVVDHRLSFANRDRFPGADAIVVGRPETIELVGLVEREATAIIISHNYLIDQQWLKRLLPFGLRYLGLMGPVKRAEKMFQELREKGLEFTDKCFTNFYNPVGLDIGADSPEQIALSILGEIQAVLTCHKGGLLREKKGAIHASERNADTGTHLTQEKISCLVSA
jgi:xanthine dehydrogenase accessory factor